jgi:hypothetical protein
MSISKQHRIYIGLIGVALLGLIADRTIFKPSDAVATSMGEFIIADSDLSEQNATQALLAAKQSLANRLKNVANSRGVNPHEVRDIFASPWTHSSATAPKAAAENSPAYEFMQRHKLTAIMGASGSGYVVIDDKCLRVGQTIDGYLLKSVTDRSAVFERTDVAQQFEYPLPGDAFDQ